MSLNFSKKEFLNIIDLVPTTVVFEFTSSLRFFMRHPLAFPFILINSDISLLTLTHLLCNHGISNGGHPFSVNTIKKHRKLIDAIKAYFYNNPSLKNPLNSIFESKDLFILQSPILNPSLSLIINSPSNTSPSNPSSSNLSEESATNTSSSNLDYSQSTFFSKIKGYSLSFISSLPFVSKLTIPPFFTYDIEAKKVNGKTIPYLFGLYSKETGYNSFYGHNCVLDGLTYLFNQENGGKVVRLYAHFGGGFDIYLIMNTIIQLGATNINYLKDVNNVIFFLTFELDGKLYEFKDSFKFLPSGLHTLFKEFSIEIFNGFCGKLPMNHYWVLKNLDYVGELPDWLVDHKDLLTNLGINVNEFSIKDYLIKYNQVDTQGLHLLIEKFANLFSSNFNVSIFGSLTISQLVMLVFRHKYLKTSDTIKLFSKSMQNRFSKAYYGANTTVNIPYGKKIYPYDINSLYPYCMLKDMPVKRPQRYDINQGLNSLFGFGLARVEAPPGMEHPILPTYVKIGGSSKLVFPTGIFKGFYFSEELKYAKKLGYKIQLISAWSFVKDNTIFEPFVTDMYNKKQTAKTGSLRTIFKLCLNTIYGRMGRHSVYRNNIITKEISVMEEIERLYSNIDIDNLDNGYLGYSYDNAPNPNLKVEDPELYNHLSSLYVHNINSTVANVAIAAAITAYGRIEADKYKRLPGIKCLYSDTDSFYLDKPVPKEYLGNEIGKLKNELADNYYTIENDINYYLEEAIFLGDKRYALKKQNGDTIIKFAGVQATYLPKGIYETLRDIYFTNKEEIKLKTGELRRKKYGIEQIIIDKVFSMDYNRRIKIYEEGVWTKTAPINLASEKIRYKDMVEIIGRQSRILNLKNKKGVKLNIGDINYYNVYNHPDYKDFDGYFLNYWIEPMAKLPEVFNNQHLTGESSTILLINTLKLLINKAIEEGILIQGIGYLITETYQNDDNEIKYKTIGYLQSFNNAEELINLYKQHLDELIEMEEMSGIKINQIQVGSSIGEGIYNVKKLSLRILMPKELIVNGKIPITL